MSLEHRFPRIHFRAIVCLALLIGWLPGCRWTSMGQNTVGVQLFQQGKYAEALQQFEAAKLADPTNADTYFNLASTYHKMGVANKDSKFLEQAEALYNQCLDISPNHVDCHRGLAVLLVESNRPDSGFTLLKKWAANNPSLSDPRLELSRLHHEFGNGKIAEQYLDEALAMDPNNFKAWAAKGRMREVSGDLQQAVQNYQQSLAINNLQPEVYQRVASINLRLASNTLTGNGIGVANSAGGTGVQAQTPSIQPNRY